MDPGGRKCNEGSNVVEKTLQRTNFVSDFSRNVKAPGDGLNPLIKL